MFKKEKGVAGLNIFLSVVATIFVLGIIVMAMALTGTTLVNSISPTGAGQNVLAGGVINNTTAAMGSVTTWFPIWITIAAVVVLILMIVLIIAALRQGGLMGGGGMGG